MTCLSDEILCKVDRVAMAVSLEPVRSAWAKHLACRCGCECELWTVLAFQAWLEHHQGAA